MAHDTAMKTTKLTLLAAITIAVSGCGDWGGDGEGSGDDRSPRASSEDAGREQEPAPQPTPPPEAPDDELDDGSRSVSVFDLAAGECLAEFEPAEVIDTLEAVSCDEPHKAQVVSLFELPDGDWPGEDVLEDAAGDRCPDSLPDDATDLEPVYLHPTEQTWTLGDREMICLALSDEPQSGSLPVG